MSRAPSLLHWTAAALLVTTTAAAHTPPVPQDDTQDPPGETASASMDEPAIPTDALLASPDGRNDLRVQVLLDRARFSPGEIDGVAGSNQAGALRAFQRQQGLDPTGEADEDTWLALEANASPTLVDVVLSEEDVAGPFVEIPSDMMAKAALASMGFTGAVEKLGERFHASPALLRELNPQARFEAGESIQVPNVEHDLELPAASTVVVDESDGALWLLDAQDAVIAWFPATSGSENDPLPIGDWTINGVAHDPVFNYDPSLFHAADPAHEKATLQPGPNNPVGVAWIDLSKPHYGIHGTPEPANISKTQSNGCIRLTNWDVVRVAGAVSPGTAVRLQE
ncbi:peptidoglycan-binding protein [Arenimonas soli]|uniref:Peptidoglycan-binding protein n=2 Tax=Arenimonas soli TaxID=2269504 RepID=A0ABQ1HI30_9GAMM|nr:L,D-transpeptidase family protein [Arenimonas soli]GGA77033.1 peptidoglycan-binding protein [Arenimonas soli]